MSQKAISLGAVGGAAVIGSLWSYNRMRTTLERNQFIEEGLKFIQQSPDSLSIWRIAQRDVMNNVGHATVQLKDGRTVRITAKRIVSPEKAGAVDKPDLASEYDDLEGEGSGLAFYWENPWEIKASIIRGVSGGIDYVKKSLLSWNTLSDQSTDEEEERWEVTSVSVDNEAIVGRIDSHPFFASKNVSNEPKSDESIRRTKYFLSLLGISACWILGRRVYVNYRIWPSYVFARNYVQKHPLVVELFEGETAEIVARTGELTRTKIDLEITITGKKKIMSESVVKFIASRKDPKSPWTVSRAILTPSGSKPIDLLVSRSLLQSPLP